MKEAYKYFMEVLKSIIKYFHKVLISLFHEKCDRLARLKVTKLVKACWGYIFHPPAINVMILMYK